jgi:hypothetical protein
MTLTGEIRRQSLKNNHTNMISRYGIFLIFSILLNPDSPDEMAFGQLRTLILIFRSGSYTGSGSGVLTNPTGERRNRQFCRYFRGLRSCRPIHPANPG